MTNLDVSELTVPQVAILHWDETKEKGPVYLTFSCFNDLVNGQLVLLTDWSRDNSAYKALLYENNPTTYWVDKSNLIFLGEL